MKKVLMLLVVGTLVSGAAAFYAGAQVLPGDKAKPDNAHTARR